MNSLSLVSASTELGGKCRACEAIGASWRTQVRIILLCLLTLTPSDGSAATFPVVGDGFVVNHFHIFRFYSYYFLFFPFCSHLPLSTANAATFPDKRGQLTICILSLFTIIRGRLAVRNISMIFLHAEAVFCMLSYMQHEKTPGSYFPRGFLFYFGRAVFMKFYFAFFFSLTRTLSMTGFPFLSLEMTSIRKRSNSGSNS